MKWLFLSLGQKKRKHQLGVLGHSEPPGLVQVRNTRTRLGTDRPGDEQICVVGENAESHQACFLCGPAAGQRLGWTEESSSFVNPTCPPKLHQLHQLHHLGNMCLLSSRSSHVQQTSRHTDALDVPQTDCGHLSEEESPDQIPQPPPPHLPSVCFVYICVFFLYFFTIT